MIEEENRGSEFPVIVLGDKKINGYIRNHTRTGSISSVTLMVTTNTSPCRKSANGSSRSQQLSEQQEERQALEQLGAAIGNGHYAAGVAEVWRPRRKHGAGFWWLKKNIGSRPFRGG